MTLPLEPLSRQHVTFAHKILFSISHKTHAPKRKSPFFVIWKTSPPSLECYPSTNQFWIFYPATDKSLIITKSFVCCQVCPTLLQPSGLSSLDVWWINTCKRIQAVLCCHRQKLPSELWLDRLSAHTDDCPAVVHFLLPCCYLTMYQNNIKGSNIILDSKGKWKRAFG